MAKVFLVGAGPGDPEMLTLKAARLLQQADVVLHDALVSQPVLDMVRSGATLIDVGKRRGHKLLTQDEINSLLLFFATGTNTVIRLKGGDPSIFGRAGEEIEALVEAGVEYEIVPGITSALASAAAARISLTDRRHASSVVLVTGHRAPGADGVHWDKLVTSGSTLAIYMPGGDYAQLSHDLRAAGLEEFTPCTVVSSAGRPDQQVLWTNLSALAQSQSLPAPALVIVGQCASSLAPLQLYHSREQIRPHDSQPKHLN